MKVPSTLMLCLLFYLPCTWASTLLPLTISNISTGFHSLGATNSTRLTAIAGVISNALIDFALQHGHDYPDAKLQTITFRSTEDIFVRRAQQLDELEFTFQHFQPPFDRSVVQWTISLDSQAPRGYEVRDNPRDEETDQPVDTPTFEFSTLKLDLEGAFDLMRQYGKFETTPIVILKKLRASVWQDEPVYCFSSYAVLGTESKSIYRWTDKCYDHNTEPLNR